MSSFSLKLFLGSSLKSSSYIGFSNSKAELVLAVSFLDALPFMPINHEISSSFLTNGQVWISLGSPQTDCHPATQVRCLAADDPQEETRQDLEVLRARTTRTAGGHHGKWDFQKTSIKA